MSAAGQQDVDAPNGQQDVEGLRSDPRVRTTVAVAALLIAWLVFGWLADAIVTQAALLFPAVLGQRLAGSALWALLVVANLAVAGALLASHRSDGDGSPSLDGLLTVLFVAGLVTFVLAYALLGTIEGLPTVPDDALTSVLGGLAVPAALALVDARLRDGDLALGLPGRDDAAAVVGAVLTALVAALAWLLAASLVGAGPFAYAPDGFLAPRADAVDLVLGTLLPTSTVAIGWAVLFTGAIQARVRDAIGAGAGVATVPALVGVLAWSGSGVSAVLTAGVGRLGAAAPAVGGAVVLVGALVVATVAVSVLELVPELAELSPVHAGPALVGVLAGLLPAVLAVLVFDPLPPAVLVAAGSLAAAAAVAAIATERTRSVWPAALAFLTYLLATDATIVVAVRRLIG